MFIKEIILNDFRVYYSENKINFDSDASKNIHLISGSNGYGKTTFLTSLIWCLYGKNMKDVEDVFKKEIDELGGYKKYVSSCMNKHSVTEMRKEFFVQITFSDVNIPSVVCEDVVVKRTGYYKSGLDDLEIYIDGHINELTREVGDELFIQDFILPREIAKFFFFDSEKIVSLAETKTIDEKRQLNKAYSEVLGIKKYVDLKKNLEDLRIRFRKDSAKESDKLEFNKLSNELLNLKAGLTELQINLESKNEEKISYQLESNILQENLIRKGSSLSLDDINNLKIDRYNYQNEINELKQSFRELIDLAPFAMSFDLLLEVKNNVKKEKLLASSIERNKLLEDKSIKIIKDINNIQLNNLNKSDYDKVKKSLIEIVNSHLNNNEINNNSSELLHNFNEQEIYSLDSIIDQLKSSYKRQLESISKGLKDNKIKLGRITKKLNDAESKESDGVIKKYRDEKINIDQKIRQLDNHISDINQKIGEAQVRATTIEKIVSELAKKIRVHEKYLEKDELSKKLIKNLEVFINDIKEEKKSSLEIRIMSGLKKLMHKDGMIQDVRVEINNDLMDITLLGSNGNEINKSSLSKGEQQLYATSLLKGLVDESNIEFPVFIDSPLQKFDQTHSSNIIRNFYPSVSKQVVLFPLLNKEMTENEYKMLKPLVKSCFVMENHSGIKTSLHNIPVNKLFSNNVKV